MGAFAIVDGSSLLIVQTMIAIIVGDQTPRITTVGGVTPTSLDSNLVGCVKPGLLAVMDFQTMVVLDNNFAEDCFKKNGACIRRYCLSFKIVGLGFEGLVRDNVGSFVTYFTCCYVGMPSYKYMYIF